MPSSKRPKLLKVRRSNFLPHGLLDFSTVPWRFLFVCLALSAITAVSGCSRGRERGLLPGDLAPDFVLTDFSGMRQALSALQGKVVILNFLASWCGPCAEEMPALERLYQHYKDRGLMVVAIGADDDERALRDFQTRLKFTFPLVFDSDRKVTTRYHVRGFPETFVLNPEGKIVLFMDLVGNNTPVSKIVGPRDWDSRGARAQIEALLPVKPTGK
jgi:peroxiredoxin